MPTMATMALYSGVWHWNSWTDSAFFVTSKNLKTLGSLYDGLANAGLSAGYGDHGLGSAYWSLGGRLSVTGNRGEFQPAA